MQVMPSTGQRWQVSVGGGTKPIWMPGGREIAYLAGRDVMTVVVALGPAVTPGRPVKLFTLAATDALLDVTHDGRFLIARQDLPAPQSPNIVVHWFEDVRRIRAGASR